jgi:hypothetical protein
MTVDRAQATVDADTTHQQHDVAAPAAGMSMTCLATLDSDRGTIAPWHHRRQHLPHRPRPPAGSRHDLDELLDRANGSTPLRRRRQHAAVLHSRIGRLAHHTEPARRPGPLRSRPTAEGPRDQHDLDPPRSSEPDTSSGDSRGNRGHRTAPSDT